MRKITSEAVKPVSFHTQPLEPEGDVLPVPCPKEPEKHITTFEGGDASPEIKCKALKTQEMNFLQMRIDIFATDFHRYIIVVGRPNLTNLHIHPIVVKKMGE
jgi:hypothetical protein